MAAELNRMKEDLARAMRRARNSTEKAAEVDRLRSRLASERCASHDEVTAAREEAVRWLSEATNAKIKAETAEKQLANMVSAEEYNAVLQRASDEAQRASAAEERLMDVQKTLMEISASYLKQTNLSESQRPLT